MVGKSVNEEKDNPTAIEIYEEQCPYYMAMGMSVSEFWDGDPHLVVYYRKAHEIRQDLINMWEWRMGAYNVSAFSITLSNAFRKKGTKPVDYMKEPFPLRETKEEIEQKRIKEQNDKFALALEKGMARFNAKKAKERKNGTSDR